MNSKNWLIIFPVILGFLCLGAAGSKSNPFVVTFHMQGGEDAARPDLITPVKLGSEHKQYFFIKIPIFTDQDIQWYQPFVSQDGNSHGAAFKLKEEKIPLLVKISSEHQGKLFGTRVVDAPLRALLIDQPIHDGIVVIWDGLSKNHLQLINTKIKHVDSFSNSGQTPNLPTFNAPKGKGNVKLPKFNLFKNKQPKESPNNNPYINPQ